MTRKSVTKPKPKRGPDDPEQSAAFIEMAGEIGADESSEEFRKALKKIAPKKASGGA